MSFTYSINLDTNLDSVGVFEFITTRAGFVSHGQFALDEGGNINVSTHDMKFQNRYFDTNVLVSFQIYQWSLEDECTVIQKSAEIMKSCSTNALFKPHDDAAFMWRNGRFWLNKIDGFLDEHRLPAMQGLDYDWTVIPPNL